MGGRHSGPRSDVIFLSIDVAPPGGALISVAPGIYREALTIGKPHIVLRSPYEDAARTVVVAPADPDSSPTVTVTANDFLAENLTIGSGSGKADPKLPGASRPVVLSVSGKRDVFRNVRVLGKTVYARRGAD